jgi:pyruvate/2-oxoglutarate/acetoin dehydrogenase E1 component
VAELLLVEAVNDALHVEMERDPSVMVMGEDVGKLGGVFRATAGLQDRFGGAGWVGTPLPAAGLRGGAGGVCMGGGRPGGEVE